ncbi:hypothetical protein HOA59_02715 [archaeon]|jgi:hypothetical protein|nr:hypothetical protein [archaeon]MBT6824324.1 hypothetical protein [archaeon]MBT7106874.1 hypothetical protein [archaeon]MBT7297426.1 hypothetical protein [archaeon]
MEKFRNLVVEANKHYKLADHMTYVSYNLIKELKILLNIIDNLNKSMERGVEALLYLDYLYKRIDRYPDNFDERLELFKRKSMARYKISPEHILLMRELSEIVMQHKKSPMEFVRDGKYVICSNGYSNMKTLDVDEVKSYVLKAKVFILRLNNILKEYDANYRLSKRGIEKGRSFVLC